jgi:hypothetical protein
MKVEQRSTCRACGGNMADLWDLGTHPLNDFPASPTERRHPPAPLVLCRCHPCGLIQLQHTVPPEWMFREHYWYRSGVNESMVAHLREIVEKARALVPVAPGDVVVDIGANDGTLLAQYEGGNGHGEAPVRIAYEPALNLQKECSEHADVVVPEFFPDPHKNCQYHMVDSCAKHIVSAAMFYDLDDPGAFVAEVKRLLHPEGIWVNQLAYLPAMLRNTAFDSICLPPDELVVTMEGLRPIGELAAGDYVLTDKGRPRRVLKKHVREYQGSLYEIRGYGFGHSISVTQDHPVQVMAEGGTKFVRACDVRVGDVLRRPIYTETKPVVTLWTPTRGTHRPESTTKELPATPEIFRLFGLYLAEGFTSHKRSDNVYFSFSHREVALAEDCAKILEDAGFTARISKTRTSLVVSACGGIARLLAEEFGRGAENKQIPYWALTIQPELQLALLNGYMEGDGYRYRRGCYWRASTVSPQLAFDLAILANRLGYKASICEQDRPETAVIEGRTVAQRPLWDVLVHMAPEKEMKTWIGKEEQWSRVRSITTTDYTGLVCNLEVEEDGTYLLPGGVVHNCHEHLAYYCLTSLMPLLARHGLQVIDVEEVPVNEGSFRVYATHRNSKVPVEHAALARVRAMAEKEGEAKFTSTNDAYLALKGRAEDLRREVRKFFLGTLMADEKVDLLGASTKGNVFLSYCGIDSRMVRRAIERSEEKVGRHTVTGVPIVSEEEGRRDPARYVLCLIWAFRDSVLKRERGKWPPGTKVVFPMPKMEVVEL